MKKQLYGGVYINNCQDINGPNCITTSQHCIRGQGKNVCLNKLCEEYKMDESSLCGENSKCIYDSNKCRNKECTDYTKDKCHNNDTCTIKNDKCEQITDCKDYRTIDACNYLNEKKCNFVVNPKSKSNPKEFHCVLKTPLQPKKK